MWTPSRVGVRTPPFPFFSPGANGTQEALAKFALNPYPIHHPEGRDIALIHLKQEEEGTLIVDIANLYW